MAATANVFALLGDGDDDIQQLAEKAAPILKEQKIAAAANVPKVDKPAPDAEPRYEGGRGGRGDRGGRGGRRGGRGGRFSDQNGVVAEDSTEEGRGENGRGRGPRPSRGRGGRGGDGYSRPSRREYERHDGTGRGHEVQKRGGAGVGNWGTETDDIKPAEALVAEDSKEPQADTYTAEYTTEYTAEYTVTDPPAPAPGAEDSAAAVETAAVEPEVPPEPEKVEITLEEYERDLAAKKAALNKVSEVKQVSMDDFKGMKTYVRKDAEESIPGLELSNKKKVPAKDDATPQKDKPKKQVQTLETGFRIADGNDFGGRGRGRGRGDRPNSGRGRGEGGGRDRAYGGRGDRGDRGDRSDRPYSGRGRGEGGRGGGRGRSGGEIPINDDSAFPSLG